MVICLQHKHLLLLHGWQSLDSFLSLFLWKTLSSRIVLLQIKSFMFGGLRKEMSPGSTKMFSNSFFNVSRLQRSLIILESGGRESLKVVIRGIRVDVFFVDN